MKDLVGSHALHDFFRKTRAELMLWLIMLALVGGSLGVAFHAPPVLTLVGTVGIAFAQVGFLLAFFMQLRGARALILLTCLYACLFVAVMFALTFDDLFTRV